MAANEVVMTKMPARVHFVLIHGMCGGAWCWYKIKCLLESSGNIATALDLRGAGIDPADPTAIHCFDDYNQPLNEFLAALPEGQKVILVGHSAGGLSVTNAVHKFPEKIYLAIYVAATMLRSGFKALNDRKMGAPDFSEHGDVFEHPQESIEYPSIVCYKKEIMRKLIYPMSSLEDFTLATILARPGPFRALKRELEAQEFDVVPRVYVKTLQDKVLNPRQQDAMIEAWPPSEVYTIDTDHSPAFSNPFELFGLLLKAASSFVNLVD